MSVQEIAQEVVKATRERLAHEGISLQTRTANAFAIEIERALVAYGDARLEQAAESFSDWRYYANDESYADIQNQIRAMKETK